MHRHEDRVSSHKADPEVQLGQLVVHHASEHLREPIISRCKNTEDGRYPHDQVKVSDHEVGLVQRNIEHRLCQERPADSASYKQRDKSDGEQHWRCKPNPAAPKGASQLNVLIAEGTPMAIVITEKAKAE